MHDQVKLIEDLKALCLRGPITANGSGSNIVGKTMQHALGISHRTTRKNILHNHTITSTISSFNSSGRTNLFAMVPDWSVSKIKSSTELVRSYGSLDTERRYQKSLFCTVNALGPNTSGLRLKVNLERKTIGEYFVKKGKEVPVVQWDVQKIERRLSKLKKTAIVQAMPVSLGTTRAFHYRYVDILGEVDLMSFLELLADGMITLDHLISLSFGSSAASEKGPLFKIRADARPELYKTMLRIDLMDL